MTKKLLFLTYIAYISLVFCNPLQGNETIYHLFDKTFILSQGDITQVPDKAIVNAANPQLSWGGGVCGAIFAASEYPQKLQNACNAIITQKKCDLSPGQAAITPSHYPKERSILYIIHAVGPNRNAQTDPGLIKKAYTSSLKLAQEHNIKSIAFPLISSAIYGFTDLDDYGSNLNPVAPALQAIEEFAQNNPKSNPQQIRLVTFGRSPYQKIKNAIEKHHGKTFIKQVPLVTAE